MFLNTEKLFCDILFCIDVLNWYQMFIEYSVFEKKINYVFKFSETFTFKFPLDDMKLNLRNNILKLIIGQYSIT